MLKVPADWIFKVVLPFTDTKEVLSDLIRAIKVETLYPVRLALLRQLAFIINKWMAASTTSTILPSVIDTVFKELTEGKKSEPAANTLGILFWVTKALLLRSDPLSDSYSSQLLSLLSHST